MMDNDKDCYSFCWSWPVLIFAAVFLWRSLWRDVRVSLYTLAQGRGTWRCLCFLFIVHVYMHSYPAVTYMPEGVGVCVYTHKSVYVHAHMWVCVCTMCIHEDSLCTTSH